MINYLLLFILGTGKHMYHSVQLPFQTLSILVRQISQVLFFGLYPRYQSSFSRRTSPGLHRTPVVSKEPSYWAARFPT